MSFGERVTRTSILRLSWGTMRYSELIRGGPARFAWQSLPISVLPCPVPPQAQRWTMLNWHSTNIPREPTSSCPGRTLGAVEGHPGLVYTPWSHRTILGAPSLSS